MAYLRCDECGGSTDTQGSWDTPIRILCESCSEKRVANRDSLRPEISEIMLHSLFSIHREDRRGCNHHNILTKFGVVECQDCGEEL